MTDTKKPDYIPIACSRHDEYELAILHKCQLRLQWSEDNVFYDQVVTPLNLYTLNSEEFLVFRADGDETQREIRLDKIRKAETV